MQLSPLPHSTAADLLRVLAGWLVLIFALQGVAAAHALGSGPLHRHAVSQHATWQGKSQTHHHDTAQRHHHASGDASGGTSIDSSVQSTPASTDGMDAAAFALTAALALLAVLASGLPAGAAGLVCACAVVQHKAAAAASAARLKVECMVRTLG